MLICAPPVLQMQFESKTLERCWYSAFDMFPKLCEKALIALLPWRRHTYTRLKLVHFCLSRQNLEIAWLRRQTCGLLSALKCYVSEKILSNKQEKNSHQISIGL
ncbi:hypothetical protein NPIL_595991 [Nephila pilipes]|uniref:Uncharacterized protein n=1 Tax=Nephila pilipes TaxID=299642 RepID=A0A8X6QU90_NEPPI|nr:hypothetical protein NPIL_595991 [Nephila pilipes]